MKDKLCSGRCRKRLDVENFYKDSSNSSGYMGRCKKCYTEWINRPNKPKRRKPKTEIGGIYDWGGDAIYC